LVVLRDGRTGIGTSVPQRRLHVRNGDTGATSHINAIAVFESFGNSCINILTPNAGSSGVYFGNTQDPAHGGILYNATTPFGLAFRVNGNSTKMVITSSGNTGIGTTSPQRKLEIAGDGLQAIRVSSNNSVQSALELKRTGSGHDWRISNNAGLLLFGQSTNDLSTVNEVVRMGGSSLTPASDNNVTLGNSSLRWTQVWAVNGTIQTSDGNDKENITSITSGLSKIMQLKPVTYHWKDTFIDMQKPHLGFIAQELKQVVPEAVVTHDWLETPDGGYPEWKETDKLGVNYSELVPLLTKAMQEQQALIAQQQETIDMLLKRIEMVEANQATAVSYTLSDKNKKIE
jgi:trimeric autotransporter adhesin